jgi:hypothetical protein
MAVVFKGGDIKAGELLGSGEIDMSLSFEAELFGSLDGETGVQ